MCIRDSLGVGSKTFGSAGSIFSEVGGSGFLADLSSEMLKASGAGGVAGTGGRTAGSSGSRGGAGLGEAGSGSGVAGAGGGEVSCVSSTGSGLAGMGGVWATEGPLCGGSSSEAGGAGSFDDPQPSNVNKTRTRGIRGFMLRTLRCGPVEVNPV